MSSPYETEPEDQGVGSVVVRRTPHHSSTSYSAKRMSYQSSSSTGTRPSDHTSRRTTTAPSDRTTGQSWTLGTPGRSQTNPANSERDLLRAPRSQPLALPPKGSDSRSESGSEMTPSPQDPMDVDNPLGPLFEGIPLRQLTTQENEELTGNSSWVGDYDDSVPLSQGGSRPSSLLSPGSGNSTSAYLGPNDHLSSDFRPGSFGHTASQNDVIMSDYHSTGMVPWNPSDGDPTTYSAPPTIPASSDSRPSFDNRSSGLNGNGRKRGRKTDGDKSATTSKRGRYS
ncbi:hypothetical protein BCR39DRAFT_557246 [Naematelia encephala]|uniref:Uncharacterized protein n=1 Tax=Naematelia encephala TaxID=71784 RepID=A0A1Y2BG52_9TREE|nr:hypothetical protein BCR39DRAFT_557246 [Naematelia encephala]